MLSLHMGLIAVVTTELSLRHHPHLITVRNPHH